MVGNVNLVLVSVINVLWCVGFLCRIRLFIGCKVLV